MNTRNDLEQRNLEDLNTVLKEAEELGKPLIKPEYLKKEEVKVESTNSSETPNTSNEVPEGHVKVTLKSGKEVVVKQEPFLEDAIEAGYDPTYEGKNKKDAAKFIQDGSYYKKIADQKKKIEKLQQEAETTKALAKKAFEHAKKMQDLATAKELKRLHDLKTERILEGDVEAVNAIEAEAAEVAKLAVAVEPPVENEIPEASEELKSWIEENSYWCNAETPENKEMAEFADVTAGLLAKKYPKLSEKEILQKTLAHVKVEYADRFDTVTNEEQVSPVDDGIGSGSTKYKGTKLSEEQYSIYKDAVDAGLKLSLEEYEKQLESLGVLKDE